MEQLLHDVGGILAVRDIWDVFVYLLFFMTLVMLILIPDKNIQPTTLMTVVLLLLIIDKVRPKNGGEFLIEGFDNGGFGTLLIHIGIAILPFIAAGLVRGRSQKDRRAMPLGVLTGIIGMVYAFAFFMSNIPQ